MKLLQPNPKHYTLSADWKYTNSGKTDIRKTFRKIREKMAAEQKVKPGKVKEFSRERANSR